MATLSKSKNTSGTPAVATNTLSQIVPKLLEAMPAGKLGEMIPRASWYRFKAVKDKMWMEVDESSVPKRDPMCRKLAQKHQNPLPWDKTDIRSDTTGKPLPMLQDVMKLWNLDSSNFHLQLEDGLREHINSHSNRTLKHIYNATVKLAATPPTMLPDSVLETLDNQLQVRTIPVTPLTEFWLASVSTFGALYEAEFISVYSKTDHPITSPKIALHWIKTLTKKVEGNIAFSEATLFAEGDKGAHDFCAKIAHKMSTGSSVRNWAKAWSTIMGKSKINNMETKMLMFGIRMANTPPEVHSGWIGNKLPSTTITDAWAGAQEAFGEAWRSTKKVKDTISTLHDEKGKKITDKATSINTKDSANDKDETMEDVEVYKDTKKTHREGTLDNETNKEKVDKEVPATPTKRMSSLKKTLKFTDEGKSPTPLSKVMKSKHAPVYFKSRSNKKPSYKKGIFKNMVFKTYVKLTLPIAIQQATEFGATEQAVLDAVTKIWKILSELDTSTFILAWNPKVENTVRPLKNGDLAKTLTKKAINDKYIEPLQMGWYTSNTTIRFRIGHNHPIDDILEDPNVIHILDESEAELTKDKIQSTDVATAVWLGGPIPEQSTLDAIEQLLLDSTAFKEQNIDQLELVVKKIILHPGKQPRGEKKINAIHVLVPEDKKAQARKALKTVYPSLPQPHYPEGIQWRAIENIADRDFTVTEQASIVAERMKHKQSAFLQDLCSTSYKHLQNVHVEVEVEPCLPLSQILMSLLSYKDPTRKLFVMVQQTYDDEPVTFSYMAESSQEVASILPILPLLLEGRLGMNVSQYFRSSCTIGTDGYQWDYDLEKVVPIGDDNQLEDVDKHWIQHTEDYPTRNKHYKEEDKGGYAINVGGFDIEGSLDRPRIMEDGNESLQTMGLQDKNSPRDMEGDMLSTQDDTEVSTFTVDLPTREDQLLEVLARNEANLPKEVLTLLKQVGTPPQGGRGEK